MTSLSTVGLHLINGLYQNLPTIGSAAGLSYAAARYLPLKLDPSNANRFTATAGIISILGYKYFEATYSYNAEQLSENRAYACILCFAGLLAKGIYHLSPEKNWMPLLKHSLLAIVTLTTSGWIIERLTGGSSSQGSSSQIRVSRLSSAEQVLKKHD